MSIDGNKALIRRYREAYNTNKLNLLNDILAPDLISHNLLPGLPQGPMGAKMAHKAVRSTFPDVQTTTDELIAEGDLVVERFTTRGTHSGAPFNGIPATGKPFSTTGVSIYRIANGKIVEHWGWDDAANVQEQLSSPAAPVAAGD